MSYAPRPLPESETESDSAVQYYSGEHYDPEVVRFFDVAHEGAQARTLTGGVDAVGDKIRGTHPRSIVVLALDHIARAAAEFRASKMAPLHQPLVVVEQLPSFVGPLDIVVVAGERSDSDHHLMDLVTAVRRGADTFVLGPARGMLIAEAPTEAVIIPALPNAEGPSPVRYIAGLHMILWGLDHDPVVVKDRLAEIAALIDEDLPQLSPERDSTVNPGRKLREFCAGARVIHSARREYVPVDFQPAEVNIGPLVAQFVAALWAVRGIGGEFVPPEELGFALEQTRHDNQLLTGNDSGVEKDLFFDPFIDQSDNHTGSAVTLKTIIWGSKESDISGSMAADIVDADNLVTTPSGVSELIRALRLITRAFAATTYEIS